MQLQKQIQPQVWALNRQTLQSIDAMLTPEQQRKFGDNLILFKSRYGRNPINAGPEDGASAVPTSATNGAVGDSSFALATGRDLLYSPHH